MPTITITREANDVIRSLSRTPWLKMYDWPTGATEKTIEVADETAEAMNAARLEGETISDAIVRIAALKASGGRTN